LLTTYKPEHKTTLSTVGVFREKKLRKLGKCFRNLTFLRGRYKTTNVHSTNLLDEKEQRYAGNDVFVTRASLMRRLLLFCAAISQSKRSFIFGFIRCNFCIHVNLFCTILNPLTGVPGISPEGKGGRCLGLTIFPHSYADFLEILGA
jgi:hypothetical protein